MLEDGTGYVRVATFNKGKRGRLPRRSRTPIARAHKIILDLRNCAGGDVQEAVDTASLFLNNGLVTYISGQRFPRQDVPIHPTGSVYSLPLAVLINQSTAGPAELVPRRSSVTNAAKWWACAALASRLSEADPVGDGSALLLAVAKYYGSDGKASVRMV